MKTAHRWFRTNSWLLGRQQYREHPWAAASDVLGQFNHICASGDIYGFFNNDHITCLQMTATLYMHKIKIMKQWMRLKYAFFLLPGKHQNILADRTVDCREDRK